MVKLVNTEDLKSSSESSPGSIPGTGTTHDKKWKRIGGIDKASPKQQRQRELFLALGVATGFDGYLKNLEDHLKRTGVSKYDYDHVVWRNCLKLYELRLRRMMNDLKARP